MYVEKFLNGRDDMLGFGASLGRAFRDCTCNRPWTLTIGGHVSSGKSLLALAIDHVFNPHFYPLGITWEHSADDIGAAQRNPSVFFLNTYSKNPAPCEQFNAQLKSLQRAYPGARVLILSNAKRGTASSLFNYKAQGLCSDRLDMNIRVYIEEDDYWNPEEDPFRRRIEMTVEDPALCRALSL